MRVLAQWRGREWRCSCRAYDSVGAALVDGPWDAVVLALAAPALRGSGDEPAPWLQDLLSATNTAASTLVFVAGGVAGSERSILLAAGAAEQRLLQLGFTAIAWQAPLPPLSASAPSAPSGPPSHIECVVPGPLLLAGPAPRAAMLAAALRGGHLPCDAVRSVEDLLFADAVVRVGPPPPSRAAPRRAAPPTQMITSLAASTRGSCYRSAPLSPASTGPSAGCGRTANCERSPPAHRASASASRSAAPDRRCCGACSRRWWCAAGCSGCSSSSRRSCCPLTSRPTLPLTLAPRRASAGRCARAPWEDERRAAALAAKHWPPRR